MTSPSLCQINKALCLKEGYDSHSTVPHLFCDMDEVLADFRGACHRLYGTSTHKEVEKILNAPGAWDDPKIQNIFATLEPMPDASQLMSGLTKLKSSGRIRLSILTALPMPWLKPSAAAQGARAKADKKNWIARHFPAATSIITCARSQKAYYGLADTVATGLQAVLIDDNKSNIKEWKSMANGLGILHTAASKSLAELHSHLDK